MYTTYQYTDVLTCLDILQELRTVFKDHCPYYRQFLLCSKSQNIKELIYWATYSISKRPSYLFVLPIYPAQGQVHHSISYKASSQTVVVFEISLSENFSPPPITHNYPPLSPICTLYDVSTLVLRRPRFVAITTYRCRVRFRQPDLVIYNIGKNFINKEFKQYINIIGINIKGVLVKAYNSINIVK